MLQSTQLFKWGPAQVKKIARFDKIIQDLARSQYILQDWCFYVHTKNLAKVGKNFTRIVQVNDLFTCTGARIGKICARLARLLQVIFLNLGTWWPGVNWESSPPSCNINGYLMFSGEANSQLSLSCLTMLESLWNFRFCDLSL